MKITLKFKGNSSAKGIKVGKYTINLLCNGTIIDSTGMAIGTYKRKVKDGGHQKDWQEIEVTLSIGNVHE